MTWKIINENELDTFKRQWPCHGLPDNLMELAFEFASNGDLVDIEARADDGTLLDSAEFDGPALLALAEDAQKKDVVTP